MNFDAVADIAVGRNIKTALAKLKLHNKYFDQFDYENKAIRFLGIFLISVDKVKENTIYHIINMIAAVKKRGGTNHYMLYEFLRSKHGLVRHMSFEYRVSMLLHHFKSYSLITSFLPFHPEFESLESDVDAIFHVSWVFYEYGKDTEKCIAGRFRIPAFGYDSNDYDSDSSDDEAQNPPLFKALDHFDQNKTIIDSESDMRLLTKFSNCCNLDDIITIVLEVRPFRNEMMRLLIRSLDIVIFSSRDTKKYDSLRNLINRFKCSGKIAKYYMTLMEKLNSIPPVPRRLEADFNKVDTFQITLFIGYMYQRCKYFRQTIDAETNRNRIVRTRYTRLDTIYKTGIISIVYNQTSLLNRLSMELEMDRNFDVKCEECHLLLIARKFYAEICEQHDNLYYSENLSIDIIKLVECAFDKIIERGFRTNYTEIIHHAREMRIEWYMDRVNDMIDHYLKEKPTPTVISI